MFNNVLFSLFKIGNMHPQMKRLYQAAKELKNITGQSNLARALNSSPQTVKNWEDRGVSKTGLITAQRVLGCSAVWLEIGEGEMLVNKGEHPPPEEITKDSGFIRIQVYPVGVVRWRDIEKYLGGDVSVVYKTIQSTLNEEGIFAITLEDSDDTMEPEFSGGSILVVNPNKQARSGHFVLARAKKGAALTLKQLVVDADQAYLKPLNPDYKTIHAEDLAVEAVVRQLIREYAD